MVKLPLFPKGNKKNVIANPPQADEAISAKREAIRNLALTTEIAALHG